MRLPDLEEGLLTAALVLEVERADVEGMIRAERLHQALLGPGAHVDGSPLHKDSDAIVKCLLVDCALGQILPTQEKDFQFAWLMAQRAIDLNDFKWRPARGHEARLEEFREQLLEGIDPGEPLAQWLREGMHPPHRQTQREAEPPRPILVSSPMHPLPKVDMTAWANAVDSQVNQFFDQRDVGEKSLTYRPQVFPISASSDNELLRTIEEQIHTSDGLVVLAAQCSWGAATELEACLRTKVPTLFLHPKSMPLSSGARSHLEAMGVAVYALQSDPQSAEVVNEIGQLVTSWLETSSALILETRRRRACIEQRYSPLLQALRSKRTQMTSLEERRALAVAGIEPSRARTILEEPWGLFSVSFPELLLLANAYGVRANVDHIVQEPVSDRPPYLTPREEAALQAFSKEAGLSADNAIRLSAAGQREIATPGPGRPRRLLTDPTKWNEVWLRLGGKDARVS